MQIARIARAHAAALRILALIEKHYRQQVIRRVIQQRVTHALVDEPAGATVSLKPLHLIGHPDETGTPRLNADELSALADVG